MKTLMLLASLLAVSAFAQPHCGHDSNFQTDHIAGKFLTPTGKTIVVALERDGTMTLDKTMVFKFEGSWYYWGEPGNELHIQVACNDINKLYVHHQYQAFGEGDTAFHDYVDEWTRIR